MQHSFKGVVIYSMNITYDCSLAVEVECECIQCIKIVSEFKWLNGDLRFTNFTVQNHKRQIKNIKLFFAPGSAQSLNPTILSIVLEEPHTTFVPVKLFNVV